MGLPSSPRSTAVTATGQRSDLNHCKTITISSICYEALPWLRKTTANHYKKLGAAFFRSLRLSLRNHEKTSFPEQTEQCTAVVFFSFAKKMSGSKDPQYLASLMTLALHHVTRRELAVKQTTTAGPNHTPHLLHNILNRFRPSIREKKRGIVLI
jgi:hypothetical protein